MLKTHEAVDDEAWSRLKLDREFKRERQDRRGLILIIF
jgi:hypothetical protein